MARSRFVDNRFGILLIALMLPIGAAALAGCTTPEETQDDGDAPPSGNGGGSGTGDGGGTEEQAAWEEVFEVTANATAVHLNLTITPMGTNATGTNGNATGTNGTSTNGTSTNETGGSDDVQNGTGVGSGLEIRILNPDGQVVVTHNTSLLGGEGSDMNMQITLLGQNGNQTATNGTGTNGTAGNETGTDTPTNETLNPDRGGFVTETVDLVEGSWRYQIWTNEQILVTSEITEEPTTAGAEDV